MSDSRRTVVESPAFLQAKKTHLAEIARLYEEAKTMSRADRLDHRAQINKKVIRWNEMVRNNSNLKNYYDLHGMTEMGALWYVKRMVEGTVGEFELETGRGNHSIRGIPRIKNRLMEEFERRPRCSIEVSSVNKGVLILRVW
ncbi:hypothetical protein GCK72_015796 [Caenorhabditis remanei]|uniref:Smr domain-containing protein n=1 Tax=Caenorhabditis remanei TaxID=31234 RepID=A0A6A5GXF5_CAERE|nr:hypothetical protein GCK72_015796 [Caenorhabditis remanei]KAF1759331.1 hypothetical protein GCK72_015796 [Caenorhabditis remanei]